MFYSFFSYKIHIFAAKINDYHKNYVSMKRTYLILAFAFAAVCTWAQGISYQRPPKVIEDIALAPATPSVSFNDNHTYMLQLQASPYYSVSELAQPELRLAGARINPGTYSLSRRRGYISAVVKQMKTGKETAVTGLPEDAAIMKAVWYPKGEKILFACREKDGIYLYAASCADGKASRVTSRRMNATVGIYVYWLDDDSFLMAAVPEQRGGVPVRNEVPAGPVVQENLGKEVAAPTYQDLLKNKYDEDLFEYYFTSQLVKITPQGEEEMGKPGIYNYLAVSPDKSLLLAVVIEKPYSYTVPYMDFPSTTLVMDMQGQVVKKIQETPVIVTAMGYDTTSPYPRHHAWRPDKPATLYWVEAQDNGNPRSKKVDNPDIVYQQEAPFTSPKQEVCRTTMRFRNIQWCDDSFALLSESSRATRRNKIYRFKPCSGGQPELLFDLSTDDQYGNPGSPYTVKNGYGKYVLYTDNSHSQLLMTGEGASPEGDMPFVSRYDMNKKKSTILWRCKAPYYETVVDIVSPEKLQVITSRQSRTEPVNYYLKDIRKNKETALTKFGNPYPMLEGVTKEKIKYKRADGIDLTATVYLPAGYDKERDGRLPVLMWAYPREYRSANDAAQVRGSQYMFTKINYGSPVFWVTRGYCVMESVEMPIVGVDDKEPNDTYIEQLVMDAEAAVKVITDMGVGDPDRIGVGGHSYGAFMTGNLLTHTKLFKAGIARSGAYNRTLTPFGFQAERRTYWEAPEVYNAMSPFMYADKLSGALLLVHGELDNNTGTFPIQSERFYQALKGNKATVRYVVLPLESHAYSAKENILHLLYEEDAWLEKYVKNAR